MNGSGIFAHDPKDASESDASTGLRYYQISFSADGNVSPKKPTTLTEVAKQRELSGNLLTEAELKRKKQISSATMEEISGHNIFGPRGEATFREIQPPPRSLAAAAAQQEARRGNRDMGTKKHTLQEDRATYCLVKTSKKIHDQKFQELTGNGIFKDGKSESRDYFGGVKKPPGGESSISLV
ncbi:hypothetical protein YC2023_033074 [Brassica napus]